MKLEYFNLLILINYIMEGLFKKKKEKLDDIEDKRIYFKYMGDENNKKFRTYVYNLQHHVDDVKSLAKSIKKALGTSSHKMKNSKESDEIYGFNGDLEDKIIKYLLDKKIVAKENIISS